MLRSFEKNGCPTLHKSNILLLNKKNYFNTLLYLWKLQYLCYEKLQSSREKSSSGKSGCFCKIVKTIYQIISLKKQKNGLRIFFYCKCYGAIQLALIPLVPGKFFSWIFVTKVHMGVHCRDTKWNPKFQVKTFIHYQDMEILNFSVFFNSATLFSNQFAISQLVCELYAKEEF